MKDRHKYIPNLHNKIQREFTQGNHFYVTTVFPSIFYDAIQINFHWKLIASGLMKCEMWNEIEYHKCII